MPLTVTDDLLYANHNLMHDKKLFKDLNYFKYWDALIKKKLLVNLKEESDFKQNNLFERKYLYIS